MKMMNTFIKMSRIVVVCILITNAFFANGQAGAKVYVGPLLAYSYDNTITPDGYMHSGYMVGIDARLNNDRMYFLLGVNYGLVDLIASKTISLFEGSKMTFLKGRIGLGFDIIRLKPNLFITGKFAGSLNYLLDYESNLLTEPGYQTINDGTAGLVGGLGVRIGFVNIDLEYEYGLFNQYNLRKDTRFDYLAITTGINF